MLEPSLFDKVGAASVSKKKARDDDEFSIHVPMERFELRISFPEGVAPGVLTGEIAYRDRRHQPPKIEQSPKAERHDDGGVDLVFAVARPGIDHNVSLAFTYANTGAADERASLPRYWAAFRIYEQLAEEPERLWTDEDVATLFATSRESKR